VKSNIFFTKTSQENTVLHIMSIMHRIIGEMFRLEYF
jgi:hypothetical protein